MPVAAIGRTGSTPISIRGSGSTLTGNARFLLGKCNVLMPKNANEMGSGLARFVSRNGLPVIVLLLAACATDNAPVAEIGQRAHSGQSGTGTVHVVVKGDTLHSISWRYGLDYRDVAKANGIGPPYTIYIGQRLQVTVKSPRKSRARSAKRPAATLSRRVTSASQRKTEKPSQDSSINWRWPLEGTIVKRFALEGDVNKGVDIAGRLGDSVASAADGVVVYAGSGLGGYGKLVIVKHDANYLSAYGHNSTLLVSEGDSVKGGQKVAEIGSSGKDLAMLHFEIRKDGKPKDPLLFLPRR